MIITVVTPVQHLTGACSLLLQISRQKISKMGIKNRRSTTIPTRSLGYLLLNQIFKKIFFLIYRSKLSKNNDEYLLDANTAKC